MSSAQESAQNCCIIIFATAWASATAPHVIALGINKYAVTLPAARQLFQPAYRRQ